MNVGAYVSGMARHCIYCIYVNAASYRKYETQVGRSLSFPIRIHLRARAYHDIASSQCHASEFEIRVRHGYTAGTDFLHRTRTRATVPARGTGTHRTVEFTVQCKTLGIVRNSRCLQHLRSLLIFDLQFVHYVTIICY
jgi:hypothetical protein